MRFVAIICYPREMPADSACVDEGNGPVSIMKDRRLLRCQTRSDAHRRFHHLGGVEIVSLALRFIAAHEFKVSVNINLRRIDGPETELRA